MSEAELRKACAMGDLDAVQTMVKRGTSVNGKDDRVRTGPSSIRARTVCFSLFLLLILTLSLPFSSFFPSFSPLFRRMAMTHCDTSYAKTHAPEQKNWSLSPLLSLSLSLSLSFFLVPPVLMSCCYHDPG